MLLVHDDDALPYFCLGQVYPSATLATATSTPAGSAARSKKDGCGGRVCNLGMRGRGNPSNLQIARFLLLGHQRAGKVKAGSKLRAPDSLAAPGGRRGLFSATSDVRQGWLALETRREGLGFPTNIHTQLHRVCLFAVGQAELWGYY